MTKPRSLILCALAGLLGNAAPAAFAQTGQESPDGAKADWEGLWVADRTFGADLAGPVSFVPLDGEWMAELAGDRVPVRREENSDGSIDWSFRFFDEGHFLGRQTEAGGAIRGHWIQAPGLIQNYPFATPVRLEAFGTGAGYQGTVKPFSQQVSLNIPLRVDDSAGFVEPPRYRTFLRNPERNLGRWFRAETAEVVGEDIHFRNADGEILASGKSVKQGERFTMLFPWFDRTVEFTRRGRSDAPGFYPRRSAEPVRSLLRPAETGDGWDTETAEAAGLDTDLLARLVSEIATSEPGGLEEPYIHGLLIARHGKLAMEEYFHGFDRDRPHDSRSAGKTIGSALLGIALQKGIFESLDTPVYPLFGGVDQFANPDPRKQRLTLRHLVSMSPGLDCVDDKETSPGNEEAMQTQTAQPDWYRFALQLPMVGEPGEQGYYCTAGINLIGGAIQRKTGESLIRFFQEEFADPLGISYYQMNLSPTEEPYMGGGIRLRPRDFLKLGQVYLDGGLWKGTRLVSEDWVEQSGGPQSSLYREGDYGFGWWRQSFDVKGQVVDTFFASGNGGQMLFVVPQLDMTVMIQAGNYSDPRTRNAFRDRFMQDFILPAAVGQDS